MIGSIRLPDRPTVHLTGQREFMPAMTPELNIREQPTRSRGIPRQTRFSCA